MNKSRMTAGKESPNPQKKRSTRQASGSGLSALGQGPKPKDQSPSHPSDPGEALRAFRAKHLLTQKQVGTMLGCAMSTVGNIESGHLEPSKQLAEKIFELIENFNVPGLKTACGGEKRVKGENAEHSTSNEQKSAQPGKSEDRRNGTLDMASTTQAPDVERQIERIVGLAIDTAAIFARAVQILAAARLQGDLILSAQALAVRSFTRLRTLIMRAETLLAKNKHLAGSGLEKSLVLAKHHLRDSAIHLLDSKYAGETLVQIVDRWLDEVIREEIKAMDSIREWKSEDQALGSGLSALDPKPKEQSQKPGSSFRSIAIEK